MEKRLAGLRQGNTEARHALLNDFWICTVRDVCCSVILARGMKGFPARMAHLANWILVRNPSIGWIASPPNSPQDAGDTRLQIDFRSRERSARVLAGGTIAKARSAKGPIDQSQHRKSRSARCGAANHLTIKTGIFHEGLTLLQRDRNAAWFAEPDGARILICSEIGSEGRNFQFAHHLVLFDLPLNPELLEQRIGRLDRIGQSSKTFRSTFLISHTARRKFWRVGITKA